MKLFLTGASGLVGSNLLRLATEHYAYEVFASLNRRVLEPKPGLSSARLDLSSRDEVLASVAEVKPDAIIHMAFFNDLKLAYEQKDAAWKVMVDSTKNLLEAAQRLDIPMLFVSSDWVFDGTQGIATEATSPNPLNYYGVLKVVGETLVTAYAKGIVARIAGVYGVNWAQGGRVLSQNLGFGNIPLLTLEYLKRGDRLGIWMYGNALNLRATPSLASDACDMMLNLIEKGAQGIFHCVGADHADRLEYAKASARAFGLNPKQIEAVAVDPKTMDLPSHAGIPADTRLDAKLTSKTLGRPLLGLDAGLAVFRKQLETGVLV
ncbi:MAG: NAD(P)-dependent oxidoreductase [Trueperaceae bacterium]|nr:NAD(P)-dependent oxidoreductase [Trueperaceae bacterium]